MKNTKAKAEEETMLWAEACGMLIYKLLEAERKNALLEKMLKQVSEQKAAHKKKSSVNKKGKT